MLYEAIVGEGPFERYANSVMESAPQLQLIPAPPALAFSDPPRRIEDLLLKMLAPDPVKRFQSMRAVTRFLDSAPGALSISNRGTLRAGAASSLRPDSKRFPASPKWVSAAVFVVLIAAEMFFFRGENVSKLMEKEIQSRSSLNESVDAVSARVGGRSIVAESEPTTHESNALPIRKPARRDALVTKSVSTRVESASIPVETRATRPVRETPVSQQNVSITSPQRGAAEEVQLTRQTNVAPAEIINREVAEAREPTRSIPNNAPVPRLKVEWEN
jgi:hypothetical protein